MTTEKFIDLLKRSGLVEEERLGSFLNDRAGRDVLTVPEEPELIAKALTDVGLITKWHADKLLQGKHKGFFLGKYKLLRHIGKGGMSSVYLAEHILMQRQVAIKVLPQNRVSDTSYLSRFYQEARAAAQLDDPNVVRAYDVDNAGNTHFIVMEYVDGRDLHQTVVDRGPLPYEDAADFIRQAAMGLAHAHRVGLIHRDVKPANLLLDSKNTIKVLDLGLAKFSETEDPSLTLANEEQVLGTADYLAPEQALDSHAADERSDIYGLGCTLYFLLTGHPPFDTGTIRERLLKHQVEPPPSIFKDRPDAPPSLINICKRMMSKKPANRFQSMDEISQVLAEWLEERGFDSKGSGSSFHLKRPEGIAAADRIGRLRRPKSSPASDTTSASNGDTAKMKGANSGTEAELSFAPIEEEKQTESKEKQEEPSNSSLVTSDASVKEDLAKEKHASSSASTKRSLIEEEFARLSDTSQEPVSGSFPALGTPPSSHSGPHKQVNASGQSDSQVLMWALLAVGAAVMILLLIAFLNN